MKCFKLFTCLTILLIGGDVAFSQPQWPVINNECKPWARWWWPGSIVTEQDLTTAMEKYHSAGLGGLELTVIYGVRGEENKFINYLSPKWMEMFSHALNEGKRLDLGIDLANASSWPFGGPWVDTTDASKEVVYKTFNLKSGETLAEPVIFNQQPLIRVNNYQKETPKFSELTDPIGKSKNLQEYAIDQIKFEKPLPLQVLVAYSDGGQILNLTNKVDASGKLNWVAPAGNWMLYAVFIGWHGKMVERAGPGGEGYVIDHFSTQAIHDFLSYFNHSFKGYDIKPLRGYFNDSYEVDDAVGQACWTPLIFDEFKARRGYDLRDYLPALFQKDAPDKNVRVLCDFRETISDLIINNFTKNWVAWAHQQGKIIRNQAHGSPGNILDMYAASDIPETEGTEILRMKFGTSAANVTGKKLASAEVATWLGEHFLTRLSDVKSTVDKDFLAGVNHVVYHGTCFSPQNEPWPGFLFYASVEFTPANSFWNDFVALNNYVAHVQSFLQSGKPDNDMLLYFPIYDSYSENQRYMLEHFDGFKNKNDNPELRKCAETILSAGSAFDYISDDQLKNVTNSEKALQTANNTYQTIILPPCHYIPLETFEKTLALARNGATIIISDSLPADVPGWHGLNERREAFMNLKKELHFTETENKTIRVAKLGNGRILLGNDLLQLMSYAKIRVEPMVEHGLQFIRRKTGKGIIYFVDNRTEKPIDGWIPLSEDIQSAAIFNPMTNECGMAKIRKTQNGMSEIYLQINPEESYIIETWKSKSEGTPYPFYKIAGDEKEIDGIWSVKFIEGGPVLPKSVEVSKLVSWTDFGGEDVKNFSGTAQYIINFAKPIGKNDAWLLDLGKVYESAKVILNGKEIATMIGPRFQVAIDNKLLRDKNTLEIRVSNLMANRIAYLDRQGVNWKRFYNVNFPARYPENRKDGLFDASKWQPKESGLIGPVTLKPLETTK